MRANDQVVFETVNYNSSAVGWTTVNPISVSSDGTSLQVVVPTRPSAAPSAWPASRVGLFLQVVPTVSNVDESSSAYHADGLTVEGSGLIEAGTTINFGGQSLADDGPSSGPDVVYDYANGSDRADGLVNLTVPNGVPYGRSPSPPSAAPATPSAETFTAIEVTATSGTPRTSDRFGQHRPGDHPHGSRFTLQHRRGLPGDRLQRQPVRAIVKPASGRPTGATDGGRAVDAMTGTVSVVGDELNTAALLQVVPVVTTAYMNGTGSAQLQGFGFIEGNGTIYSFDGSTLVDTSTTSGPDVLYNYANGSNITNALVNSRLPSPATGP